MWVDQNWERTRREKKETTKDGNSPTQEFLRRGTQEDSRTRVEIVQSTIDE